MYAQVIQGGAAPEQRAAMDNVVHEQMIPALPALPALASIAVITSGNRKPISVWDVNALA